MPRRDDEDGETKSGPAATAGFVVGDRVRVYPGSSDECSGVIVEDFGDDAGHSVDVAGQHIADASRRWAIILDDGNLMFADSFQLANDDDRRR